MTKNIAKSVTTRHKRQWTIIKCFKLTVTSHHLHQTCFQLNQTKAQHSRSVPNVYFNLLYASNKNLVIIYQIYINDLSNKRNSVSR